MALKTVIGIDIGNDTTKVVEVDQQSMRIVTLFSFATPVKMSGQAQTRQIEVSVFWKEIAGRIPLARLKASRCAVSLSGAAINLVSLQLPKMSRSELSLAALAEAKRKMLPATGPHHVFEQLFLGEQVINKVPKQIVTVIRAEKKDIQEIITLFKHIESVPVLICPGCAALPTMVPKEILKKDLDSAFVDIGEKCISIFIFHKGSLFFMRTISLGMSDIIKDIATQLGVTEERGRAIVQEKGIPEVSVDLSNKVAVAEEIMKQKYEANQANGQGPQGQDVNLLELRVAFQSHLEKIVQEIRRSLVFYKEQFAEGQVEYIYFCGGGSQLKNLVPTLSKQIGGQLAVLFPFKDTTLPKNEASASAADATPIFVAAAGSAFLVLNRALFKQTANFLPVEIKKRELIAVRRFAFVSGGILVICALGGTSVYALFSQGFLQQSIDRVTRELSQFKDVSSRLKELSHQEETIKQRSVIIETLVKEAPDFRAPLKELSSLIPREVILQKCEIFGMASGQGGGSSSALSFQMKAEAVVLDDYERGRDIIIEFKKRLEASRSFSTVAVTELDLETISSDKVAHTASDVQLTQVKPRKFNFSADVKRR